MKVFKDGELMFEGTLKQCWAYLRPRMIKGQRLVDGAEVESDTVNLLPEKYTVHAAEGEY